MTRVAVSGTLAVLVILTCAPSAAAQEGKSVALAKQLASALDAAKLDSIAAKDPSTPDTYVAALYFPGSQLLVVSAKYSAPQLLDARLTKKEYRDAYIDLSSASVPASKIFVQDSAGDGLHAKVNEGQAPDSYEAAGKPMLFNGDWKGQKVSEQDYMKAFTAADEKYSSMLTALLAQLKPTS